MKCEFLTKHSRSPGKNIILLLFVFVLTAVPEVLLGQMFSVESESDDQILTQNAAYIGLEAADFEYQGKPGLVNSDRYAFSGLLLVLRYETQPVDIFMSAGGEVTGIKEVNYYSIGVELGYDWTLIGNKKLTLVLPFHVRPAFTSAANREVVGNTAQFQQTAIPLTAGVDIQARLAENILLSANAMPSYGYSFASGGTFGGKVAGFEGGVHLYFYEVLGDLGLTTGYDYKLKSYDIDGQQFDYDLASHNFLVGITF